MTKTSRLALSALFASALATGAALSTPALAAGAATTIKVVEGGEGGGPMTLTLEPATVKAGPAVFNVHNDAVSEEHEMIVVHLKSADQAIPLNTTKHRVDESKLKSLGEVEDLKPGQDGTLKATLKPGTYLVFCNIKGHYEAGMQGKLTVTK
ncbi:cupredoxin domain-containing protein [Rhizobium sp. CC-YZS058]|uniref:cupredoxin domain-containing protein n=1 Tax=Rhizobium sp. CC-YZS058 TaxID=3042153 RepID=UPI002B057149|nr:cupredoxin domain-containing protein [Rhizobium sp. CC-YZS058]MEA3534061.1 cupredoxin domain-containing protein [Rhizobium sp. CC-YZS058]